MVGCWSAGVAFFHHFWRFEDFFLNFNTVVMWSAVVASSCTCSLVTVSISLFTWTIILFNFRFIVRLVFSINFITIYYVIYLEISLVSFASRFLSFDATIVAVSVISNCVEIAFYIMTFLVKEDQLAVIIVIIFVVRIVAGDFFETLLSILRFTSAVFLCSRTLAISSSSSLHFTVWILLHDFFFNLVNVILAGSASFNEQMVFLINIPVLII